jgi:ankyrin repeat protein
MDDNASGGQSPDGRLHDGHFLSSLLFHVNQGDVDGMKKLINTPSNALDPNERWGDVQEAALHVAVCLKDPKTRHEMVSVLLQVEGIDINVKDVDQETPLHYTCRGIGFVDTLQTLLPGKDIRLNTVDKNGSTALAYTAMAGHLVKFELVASHRNGDEMADVTAVNINNDSILHVLAGNLYTSYHKGYMEDETDISDMVIGRNLILKRATD